MEPSEYQADFNQNIEKLNQKLEDYKSLLEIGLIISSENDINSIAKEICYGLVTKYQIEYVLILLFQDEIQKEMKYFIFENFQETKKTLSFTEIAPIKSFFHSHPNQVDFSTFSFLIPTEIINQLIQFKPEILFPLKTTDNIFGFMMLSSNQGKQYSQDDIEFISSIASFASIAIQNKKNYLKAITDLKTGLYIYTYFMQRMNEEIEVFKRYNDVFSVIMMDIDSFKDVNDNFGHMIGDLVLLELAKIIKNCIRLNIDIPARFGGDEFAVLFPRTSNYIAFQIAERIRSKVAQSTFFFDGKELKFTVSIGVSTIYSQINTPEEFINACDKALYYSKNSGKNRVTSFYKNKFGKYPISK
jgi:diguanylate cyclase (GGDEF)-like protein